MGNVVLSSYLVSKLSRFIVLSLLLWLLLGGYISLETIWVIADIVNGLMAIPNLIALLALSPIIIKETKHYFDNH
mgnify:CR=1 FL=1